MLPSQTRTPSQIMGELLTGHPEAASLQSEARHRLALADGSATSASRAFAVAQAARLGYEELRHRLDPRLQRTLNFGAGLAFLALLGAGLALSNAIELGGLRPGLPATAVWLTGAWLTALGTREHRGRPVCTAIAVAVLLDVLLAAPHDFARRPVVFAAFILVLAAGAVVIMSRMESAALFQARWHWHRTRAVHQAAVRLEWHDVKAAKAATDSWFGLVRIRANAVSGGDEHFVHETVTLAMALLEYGREQLLVRPQPPSVTAKY
ncbi:MAG TPA: hypothetical protein VN969_09770 [Streptosporangiaceae bacterium]|nr:hypothetical protein [Streptosporangiaceae bacterium]